MKNSKKFKIPGVVLVITLVLQLNGFAQSRIILNGAVIKLSDGVSLVVDNPNANAITRLDSGMIIGEGQLNVVRWQLGSNAGTYLIPWGSSDLSYIPLQFTTASGLGNGYFLFSTYQTSWQNSLSLPSGVSNQNGISGTDNSALVADRYWRIEATNYTTKPTLSNVSFTYTDDEWNDSGNEIEEDLLRPQRYNGTSNTWIDRSFSNAIDTVANTVIVEIIPSAELHAWWELSSEGRSKYWVSSSASEWHNPTNWSDQSGGSGNSALPNRADNVYFNNYVGNCSLTQDIHVNSLTVSSQYTGTFGMQDKNITLAGAGTFGGGVVTATASNMSVGGNFTVAGSVFNAPQGVLSLTGNFSMTSGKFNHNNGTVRFNGDANMTQTISSYEVTTFNNIDVTNDSSIPGLSIQSSENLKGVLSLSEGVSVDTDGSTNAAVFKLLSTADSPTQDAAIGILPEGATISGKITVQRYMTIEGTNNGRIYRYVGSPLLNATVADIQNEIKITGTFTGTSKCSGCTTAQSMFAYNESITTDINNSGVADMNDGYVDFPDASNLETLVPGRGYALYVRGNLLTGSALWDVRGNPTTGNVTPVSFPITFTESDTISSDGWNLIANPFPSTIDWNSPEGWTKTNIDGAIYTTDNGGVFTQYATYNGLVGINGGSEYIAIGQAFWIKANGPSPVLTADEKIKAPGEQSTFFRKRGDYTNLLRIKLTRGTSRDETIVHLRADATDGLDSSVDAIKFMNSGLNLSSLLADGRKLAINSLSPLNCSKSVRLSIDNTPAADYTLDFSEFDSFAAGVSITLLDSLTGKVIDVRKQSSYPFSVTSNSLSFGKNRFRIVFSVATAKTFQLSSADVCEGNDGFVVVKNSEANATYALASGGTVIETKPGNSLDLTFLITDAYLQTGENIFTVSATVVGCTKAIEEAITLELTPVFSTTLPGRSFTCGEGPVTIHAEGAPVDATYNWYSTETGLTPIEGVHGDEFTTPYLDKTSTYYVAIVNAAGCEGPRTKAVAEVVDVPVVVISDGNGKLTSNYAVGNQWYFEGMPIAEATLSTHTPRKSGIYRLTVSINGCESSAEVAVTVDESTIITETLPEISQLTLYPNPVNDYAYVDIPFAQDIVDKVQVLNAQGKRVGSVEYQELNSMTRCKLKMTELPPGIYLVEISTRTGKYKIKALKN
jgi:hypothetical protein